VSLRRKDRARKDEAKVERRQAILDAAWAMFQSTPYPAITMAEVAERSELAKGTVYLYFKTKEQMFVEIGQAQLEAWFDEIDAALDGRALDADGLTDLLCRSLEARPGLIRLLAMLHSVLEQNIDFETALSFKRMLVRRVSRTGALLEAGLDFLAVGEGARLLLRVYALIVGLHSLADPLPGVAEVMDEPGLDILAIDFSRELSATLKALMRGMETNRHG
jgi:AcrR family transcriptional regulator